MVNSNLEVRTSVAINAATGAAEDGALFTYEALPRATVLYWEVTCRNPKHFQIDKSADSSTTKVTWLRSRNPKHFQIDKSEIGIETPGEVHKVVADAHDHLKHLGIGGMGTRGMGRLRVLNERAAS